jgi:hypothetical protein
MAWAPEPGSAQLPSSTQNGDIGLTAGPARENVSR